MKKIIVIIILFVLFKSSFAQTTNAPSTNFTEGQPLNIEGIEFIYTLGVENVKVIDSARYSFFELCTTLTNKGKFSKISKLEKEKTMLNPEFDLTRKAYLAKVQVINAIQLPTTKLFDVISKEPNIELPSYTKRSFIGNKKTIVEGFNLQSGQSISSCILVAVPNGQKPNVSLQALMSPAF
jgi:hypothetical protein